MIGLLDTAHTHQDFTLSNVDSSLSGISTHAHTHQDFTLSNVDSSLSGISTHVEEEESPTSAGIEEPDYRGLTAGKLHIGASIQQVLQVPLQQRAAVSKSLVK